MLASHLRPAKWPRLSPCIDFDSRSLDAVGTAGQASSGTQAGPRPARHRSVRPAGFTLVEILVATVLTLMMMGLVVTVFALVSDNISGSRSTLEMTDRLRATKNRLEYDLEGITARMFPPRDPSLGEGYFEYIEGPIGPVIPPWKFAQDTDVPGVVGVDDPPATNPTDPPSVDDLTAGDTDDILMFTTRSDGEPFVGRFGATQTAQSQFAEVCWFVRGNKLYRRQLLILPGVNNERRVPGWDPVNPPGTTDLEVPGFYSRYDVSVHQEGGVFDPSGQFPAARLRFNSLADLTRRECRYGHQPWAFPYDARFWGRLGLPTLRECSFLTGLESATPEGLWPFPLQRSGIGSTADPPFRQPEFELWNTLGRMIVPIGPGGSNLSLSTAYDQMTDFEHPAGERLELTPRAGLPFDAWRRPNAWAEVDPQTGLLLRYARDPNPNANPVESAVRTDEDLILENVIGFDVKAWDPGAPIFQVDTAAGQVTYLGPDDPAYIGGVSNVSPHDPSHASALGLVPYILHVLAVGGGAAPIAAKRPVGYGAFVDLNYMCLAGVDGNTPTDRQTADYPLRNNTNLANLAAVNDILPSTNPIFHGPADVTGSTNANGATAWNFLSKLYGSAPWTMNWAASIVTYPTPDYWFASVYDTGSTSYERDGLDQNLNGQFDEGTDGVDNNGQFGVDDAAELEAPPPYTAPLTGLQVKIRVFDPQSRQIREMTIIKQFEQ